MAALTREMLLTPEGLLDALDRIAPGLARFSRADMMGEMAWEDVTLHTVLSHFRGCFRESRATEQELAGLAKLIETSLEVRDDLENAVMTCFVEAGIDKRLGEHLTRTTKAYIKAN